MNDIVAVFDIDGVFTDGTFWQTENGKFAKRFGADDFDAIDELSKHIDVCLITADKKGYKIVEKRFNEKGRTVNLVSNSPKSRWQWINQTFEDKTIVYVGDGIYDWYPLEQAALAITTCDALPHVQARADYISPRTGANRFVADACLHIIQYYKLGDRWCPGL